MASIRLTHEFKMRSVSSIQAIGGFSDLIVRLLLDNGANTNVSERRDFTPLHVAPANGDSSRFLSRYLNK